MRRQTNFGPVFKGTLWQATLLAEDGTVTPCVPFDFTGYTAAIEVRNEGHNLPTLLSIPCTLTLGAIDFSQVIDIDAGIYFYRLVVNDGTNDFVWAYGRLVVADESGNYIPKSSLTNEDRTIIVNQNTPVNIIVN